MIVEDQQLIEKAKEYAERFNYEIWYINNRLYKTKGVKNLRNISPQEWVNIFLNAKMVFTNSFHGIVFSINFNKPFLASKLKENTDVNARIVEVLKSFRAESHLLDENSVSSKEEIDICAVDANNILTLFRKKSFSYIDTVLRNEIDNEKNNT